MAETGRDRFRETVIKIFHEEEVRPGDRIQWRIVSWRGLEPVFEIRRLFYSESEGGWRPGRLKPISWDDFQLLEEKFEEIREILELEVSRYRQVRRKAATNAHNESQIEEDE